MIKFIPRAVRSLMFTPSAIAAQDFDDGLEADKAGDYTTALRKFRLAAEQGDADAQTVLGIMYADGRGVVQDDTEAVKWYQLAAEQGDADAYNYLGNMYADGRGVAQDDAEAVKWYRQAAGQGDAHAQHDLGLMYAEGHGVLQDYGTAHMWFNIAAANGHEKARESRDSLADKMTADAIVEAQRRARACLDSDYQDCG